jgi:dCTP deaminase
MPLNDRQIAALAEHGMIAPYEPGQVRGGVISYGVSSFGYDIRASREWKILWPRSGAVLDPKHVDPSLWETVEADYIDIPANSFVLGRSLEYFRLPRHITGLAIGKSTYARIGSHPHITPLEAGWEGELTIEIANAAPMPSRVYALEGIAQILFLAGDEPVVSYKDRGGKYQGQRGVTLAKVEG